MQLCLFDDNTDYFFCRMVRYINSLDYMGHYNGNYRNTLLDAFAVASEANEQGHPKAWFYMTILEAHAKNAKIDLHTDKQQITHDYQPKFDF